MKKTIGNNFTQAIRIEPGYEDFFAEIRDITGDSQPEEQTGETLRRYVQDFLKACDLGQFHKMPDEPYSRIYLGRDEATGWETIMMCWVKGSATTIHGHPGFAAYISPKAGSGSSCSSWMRMETRSRLIQLKPRMVMDFSRSADRIRSTTISTGSPA